MSRLFFALRTPPGPARTLARIVAKLEDAGVPGRYPPPENLHVTLLFVGEVPETSVPSVCEVGRRVALRVPPSLVRTFRQRLLLFEQPSRLVVYTRVIDAGLDTFLATLHEELRNLLVDIPGVRLEPARKYRPHMTLARLQPLSPDAVRLIQEIEVPEVGWSVDSFDLIESTLTPEGSVYETIESFTFGGARPD